MIWGSNELIVDCRGCSAMKFKLSLYILFGEFDVMYAFFSKREHCAYIASCK